MAASRFVVGIDLGTTNSVLAYVDTGAGEIDADAPDLRVLPVPQLVKAGERRWKVEFNVRPSS